MKSTSRKIIAVICIGITVALASAFAHAQGTTNPITVTPFSTGLSDACAGKDCYSLFSGFADALGGKFGAVQGADSLGALINALVALGIGIGGVLAVVLLMYEGYRYMRTDSSPELSRVKANSLNIVMGFLLLLCVFVILRTINPDLLNLMPRIDTAQLDPNEGGDGSDPGNVSDQDVPPPSTTTKSCPAGVTKIQGIIICKNIATKLDQMLTAAKNSGITLGGGGYRDPQSQINLRAKNCGGGSHYNIYEKPSMQCNPPTAIPGTSRHEAGLAVDFTCNGQGTINNSSRPSTRACFNWLSGNASKYGFYNLPAENWHWSIDGK